MLDVAIPERLNQEMKNVLLIYHEVPEDLVVYNLTVSDEEHAKIMLCRNMYGNSVDLGKAPPDVQKAVDWLGDQIYLIKRWTDNIVDPGEALTLTQPCDVVVTGWML